VAEDVAEGGDGIEVLDGIQFVAGELGFEPAEAAQEADGVNDAVEGVAFGGGFGLVELVILGAEGFGGGGIFAGEDQGLGIDAGLEGVEAGAVLALGGARAGRLLRVEAVGLDLLVGCHGGGLSWKFGSNKKASPAEAGRLGGSVKSPLIHW